MKMQNFLRSRSYGHIFHRLDVVFSGARDLKNSQFTTSYHFCHLPLLNGMKITKKTCNKQIETNNYKNSMKNNGIYYNTALYSSVKTWLIDVH